MCTFARHLVSVNMNNTKANQLIAQIAAKVESDGINAEMLTPMLQELRELAKMEKDPLVIRSIRMAYEHLENNDSWEFPTIKPEEDEEGNPMSDEGNTAEEHFAYLLHLWTKSDNKYNRDEMRELANEMNSF
jgi:hypothetical protein